MCIGKSGEWVKKALFAMYTGKGRKSAGYYVYRKKKEAGKKSADYCIHRKKKRVGKKNR